MKDAFPPNIILSAFHRWTVLHCDILYIAELQENPKRLIVRKPVGIIIVNIIYYNWSFIANLPNNELINCIHKQIGNNGKM